MKKRSLLTLLMVIVSLSFLLAACSSGNDPASKENSGDKTASASQGTTNEEGNNNGKAKAIDSLTLTVGGASPGGFWSLLGNGIGNIVQKEIKNTQYSYETGNGVRNVIDVTSGKIPTGIAFNFEVMAGLNGDQPFPSKVEGVTALFTLYDNSPVQVIISKKFSEKYGIETMQDIADKKPPIRVAVNQRGNLSEAVNRNIFEAYGISYEDIKKWGGEVYYEPYKSASDMMKDDQVDWIGVPVFAPNGKFVELASSTDIKLLSLNEKAQKLLKEKMGLPASIIKAGTYKWQGDDVATVNAGAVFLADPNMSNDEAYTITKTIVGNIDDYKALHKNLSPLTKEAMANVAPAKLHPGAEQYFKEIGVLK